MGMVLLFDSTLILTFDLLECKMQVLYLLGKEKDAEDLIVESIDILEVCQNSFKMNADGLLHYL